ARPRCARGGDDGCRRPARPVGGAATGRRARRRGHGGRHTRARARRDADGPAHHERAREPSRGRDRALPGAGRAVLERVRASGDRYEFETEFLIGAARAGFTIAAIPVPTMYGAPSHFRAVRDTALVVRAIWRQRAGAFA